MKYCFVDNEYIGGIATPPNSQINFKRERKLITLRPLRSLRLKRV